MRGVTENINNKYLRKARFASGLLKIVPSILLVGVSGSVSRREAKKSSDIDFFVVCKENRIFSSRFLAKLILILFKLARKNHDKNPAGKICLNYFLSETSLDFKPHNHEVVRHHRQSIILFSRGDIYQKLVRANRWLSPQFQTENCQFLANTFFDRYILTHLLEKLSKMYQIKKILRDPITTEYPNDIIFEDQELRFHPPKGIE